MVTVFEFRINFVVLGAPEKHVRYEWSLRHFQRDYGLAAFRWNCVSRTRQYTIESKYFTKHSLDKMINYSGLLILSPDGKVLK